MTAISGAQALHRSGLWPTDYVPLRHLEVVVTATPEAIERDLACLVVVYVAGVRLEYPAKRHSTAHAMVRRIVHTMKLTKLPGRPHWRSKRP